MKLSEYPQVIEALNQILMDYGYLKYDATWPNRDVLHIKVTDSEVERNLQVIIDICQKLQAKTNKKYYFLYGGPYKDGDNFNEVWTSFILREENSK